MEEMVLAYVTYNLDDGNDMTPIGVYPTEQEAISELIKLIESNGDYVDFVGTMQGITYSEKEELLLKKHYITTGNFSTIYRYVTVDVKKG